MQASMKWDFAILIAGFLLGAWLQSEYSFTTHTLGIARRTFCPYYVLSSKVDSV